jgi:hypothetical protein
MSDDYRGLGWKFGALTVQRHAAMLAPLTFLLPGGRQVNPMHIAPWADEAGTETLPGILRRLRGEWPCVPFGYAVPGDASPPGWAAVMGPPGPDEEVHGYSSNHAWNWEAAPHGSLALSIDYPDGNPVARLERTITPDPAAPAVDLTLTIHIREACELPLGLHATFRLPEAAGEAVIEPARFRTGRTFPGTVEPGKEIFAVDRLFTSLSSVPGRDGGNLDASHVPLPMATEELLQLDDIDGSVALANTVERYRVRLTWPRQHFPSLLLWYSNLGRNQSPWDGRHLALGMEPICSPFGLGPDTARRPNPVSTAGTPTVRAFAAGEVFTTRYRIAVDPL